MTTTDTKLKILLKHLAVRCGFHATDTLKENETRCYCCAGDNTYKKVTCGGDILKCEYDEEKDGVIE